VVARRHPAVPAPAPEAAGAAVGRVLPGAGQPGDDGGAAAADDQGEPGGQLADHVRGGDVVTGGVVLAADLPRRLSAQGAGRLERGRVGAADRGGRVLAAVDRGPCGPGGIGCSREYASSADLPR